MKWDYIFNQEGLTDVLIETSNLPGKKVLRRLNNFQNLKLLPLLEYPAQVSSNIQIYIFLTDFMPLFWPGYLLLSWQWSWACMSILKPTVRTQTFSMVIILGLIHVLSWIFFLVQIRHFRNFYITEMPVPVLYCICRSYICKTTQKHCPVSILNLMLHSLINIHVFYVPNL